MFRNSIIVCAILAGCGGPATQISPQVQPQSYPDLLEQYTSCSGKGKINSIGPIHGTMSFTFMSQRDSSFFQFTDPFGRKALLMWITPNSVSAWNLIENKQYSYAKIIEFFPFLQIVEPADVTKFLWGIQPDYPKQHGNEDAHVFQDIVLEFGSDALGTEANALVSAKFLDEKSKQTVKIQIKDRNRKQSQIDMKRFWKFHAS